MPTGPKEDLAPLMVAAKGQTPGSAYLGYDQSPFLPRSGGGDQGLRLDPIGEDSTWSMPSPGFG